MQKLLTPDTVHQLDEATVEALHIDTYQLMESAAREVSLFVRSTYPTSRPVVAFAGPGNNGGDALCAARMLREEGYQVRCFLFNVRGELSPCCQRAREAFLALPQADLTEVSSQFEAPELTPQTVVLDGLFGIGLNKPLSGGFALLVKHINASGAEVVSIDMPSGLRSDDNTLCTRAHVVRATHTLTFVAPKVAQLLPDNDDQVGQLHVLSIPTSDTALAALPATDFVVEPADVCKLLHPRARYGHKGTFGHALLVAGRYGQAGAAILAARAALRSGLGKVTVHTPLLNNNLLQLGVPEACLSHDRHDMVFTTPVATDGYDALGIGPGLGTDPATALAFIEQVRRAHVPVVVDADGFNILGGHRGWMSQIPEHTIFTPHVGEFCRISACQPDSWSILSEARAMAERHHIYIVLKGHNTAVLTPEGQAYFTPRGGNGMATAGSGDVLTGIIASLLAQRYAAFDACLLGVWLHATAGDLAAETLCPESLIASDLIDFLPAAFRALRRGPEPGEPFVRDFH